MSILNIQDLHQKFRDRTNSINASIVDYRMLTPQLAKVVVSFVVGSSVSKIQLQHALAKTLRDKGLAIESSFRIASTTHGVTAVVGFVRAGSTIREYKPETSGFKVMASNLLMDESDTSLWQINDAPDGTRYLARHGTEDLSQLVHLAKVTSNTLPKLKMLSTVDVSVGDFVAYVNRSSLEVNHGYAICANADSVSILPVDGENETLDTISLDDVVESVDLEGEDVTTAAMQTAALQDPEKLKEYYSQVYSGQPEYYAKLCRIIDEAAAL
jgi:hypothetical protein